MKTLDKREVTTILAGLRYLQANRDDAIEAMSDFDDAAGTETKPFLLTETEIDKLCERINLDGDLTLTKKSKMTVYVVYVGGKVKGILTAKEYLEIDSAYWDELKPVDIPVADWNAEKVTIATIQNYL